MSSLTHTGARAVLRLAPARLLEPQVDENRQDARHTEIVEIALGCAHHSSPSRTKLSKRLRPRFRGLGVV